MMPGGNPWRTTALPVLVSLLSISPAIVVGGAAGRGGADAPTAALAADTVTAVADTARLMQWVRDLADDSMEGRAAGTAGGARARAYLLREVRALGLEPLGGTVAGLPAADDPFLQPVRVRVRPGSDSVGANIVARLRGTAAGGDDAPVLVLTAHYDHVGVRNDAVYNGADDDASGVAALLEIARHLRASPPRHDVVFVWFDAEEQGLLGSRQFVANAPLAIGRMLDVNLDMVARQDRGAIWVAGLSHTPALRAVAERAAQASPVPVRFGHDTSADGPSNDWTSQSDHGSFHRAGRPFLYLGVEDHPDYHKPTDDWPRIDARFYGGVVTFALSLVRELDADGALLRSLRSLRSPDAR